MKTSHIVLIVVGTVLLAGTLLSIIFRNGIISADQAVKKSWGNVEAAYQYRFDLIPNIVSTVKGYTEHESTTLQGVTDARAGKVNNAGEELQSLTNSTKSELNNPQLSTQQRQSVLSKFQKEYSLYINAVHEAYPNLKANDNYLAMQDVLAGTESRIKKARENFNASVEAYNNKVLRFPGSLFAWGYSEKEMFKADEAASSAPKVEF